MRGIETTIEKATFVEGRISGAADVEVLGRVDGVIELDATLFVEESGIVVGDAKVVEAVVAGTFVGTINASDSIRVTEFGRVVGELNAPHVIIDEGAALDATVATEEGSAAKIESPRRAAPARAERPARTPPTAARRAKPAPARKKTRRPMPVKKAKAPVTEPVSPDTEATE